MWLPLDNVLAAFAARSRVSELAPPPFYVVLIFRVPSTHSNSRMTSLPRNTVALSQRLPPLPPRPHCFPFSRRACLGMLQRCVGVWTVLCLLCVTEGVDLRARSTASMRSGSVSRCRTAGRRPWCMLVASRFQIIRQAETPSSFRISSRTHISGWRPRARSLSNRVEWIEGTTYAYIYSPADHHLSKFRACVVQRSKRGWVSVTSTFNSSPGPSVGSPGAASGFGRLHAVFLRIPLSCVPLFAPACVGVEARSAAHLLLVEIGPSVRVS